MNKQRKLGHFITAYAKIKPVEDLGAIAADLRAKGERVVLAHGVFDLLHFGHVRHLAAARREGDVLIVTITADAYVNKGPNRPVFTEQMRAEMLAALESVDYVGIHHGPSAEPVLHAVKPDIYAKGKEYSVAEDDVTGKIVAEQEAVEEHGGRVVFTEGITYSSSSLLNKHFNIYDPRLQQQLDLLRQNDGLGRLTGLIDKVAGLSVCMVGDTIIDEYHYVEAMGKANKENIIATRYQKGELFAGGAIAAANHVAAFCKQVDLITCLGRDDSYEDLVRQSLRENVRLTVVYRDDAPTTRKARYIDLGYSVRKMFEVAYIEDAPLPQDVQVQVDTAAAEKARAADMTIVTDFGHGLIAPSTIAAMSENAKFLAVNTQTNSANFGFNLITKYPRADYVVLDGPEARLAAGDRFSDLLEIAETLPQRINCPRMIVTSGKHGCYTFDADAGVTRLPALTTAIVDTMGAGDAFFAVSAPMVAVGADILDAGFIGNAAGGLMVSVVGHRSSVDKAGLVKWITALLK